MTRPPPAFAVMIKPRGAVCNLDCSYCFYLEKEELYPGGDSRMSDEVLESYTRQMIAAQRVPEVSFDWQGGEPTLMGLDFFRRAVELQREHARPGMRVFNSIQTNGVLLDDEWCRFLAENGFLVGVSIDGPKALHDRYRVSKGGEPTFDRVMAGIDRLKAHEVEWNVLTCVHAANAPHPLEVYRFLRDELGAWFIQLIPIVEPTVDGVSDRTVPAAAWGDFLIAVFDEWVRLDVGETFVSLFDAALASWVGAGATLCIFAPTCGHALALEHNGDLYSCDHFVEPEHRLGNVLTGPLPDLVGSDRQRAFGADKRDALPRYCRECDVRFACHGECPKNRIIGTPDGEPGLNRLCEGYQAFFRHIDRPMRFMAGELRAERPPSNVMGWIARRP